MGIEEAAVLVILVLIVEGKNGEGKEKKWNIDEC